jgi:hypothetical protein
MVTLASLPTLDVYVAFNPNEGSTALFACQGQALPASGASNSYWTNICNGTNVLSFTTNSGKQHYLDRVEAATLSMVVDNRDGFFTNGSVNGSGYVLDSRCPIAVTLTWTGTTYPAFFGLTDQITENIIDFSNSTLTIQASDFLKQLSLKYMSSTNFWKTYAQSTSATNWYRCDSTNTAVITAATGVYSSGPNTTTITYTAFNNFSTGQNVTILGLGILSGHALNFDNAVVNATPTASGFSVTVSGNHAGTSSGTGSAYQTGLIDQIGSANGNFLGSVAFPTYGAMIYDTDGCVDLTGGTAIATQNSSGYIRLGSYSSKYGIDFWILGQNLANSLLANSMSYNSGVDTLQTYVSSTGFYAVSANNVAYVSTVQVNDGYWHHVGITSDGSGNLHGYVDGTAFSIGAPAGPFAATLNLVIGAAGTALIPGCAGQVDEIVISGGSSLSTLNNEINSRYRAGTLLQLPTNPVQSAVLSGDRIAEVLCIAGFGKITNGAIVLNSNLYFINNGPAWVNGTSGNGFIHVEPLYWDTPVTTSTALDLIGEITDSDIGNFFQKPDGTMNFFNQNFYGAWAWNASTNTGTWRPTSYTPTGAHVWSDDSTSTYNYYGPGTQVVRDDADTWPMVEITPQAGTMQTYENISAEARYGYSVLTKSSTLHPTLNLALSTANYLGYLFRSPLPRVQAVELQTQNNNGGSNTALFGTKLGDVVNFIRTMPNASISGTDPAQCGGINTNMVVESIQLDFDSEGGSYSATFTCDPYPVRS